MRFGVGLTGRYKPGKEHALEAKRTFGLVDEQAPQPPSNKEELPAVDVYGLDDTGDAEREEGAEEVDGEEEEGEEDEGRFDSFSLSNSLESLLDQSLVRVIQTRIKYGLGWAGAETLVAETERLQRTADDVLRANRKVRSYLYA